MKTVYTFVLLLASACASAQYQPVQPTTPRPVICHTVILPNGQMTTVCQ